MKLETFNKCTFYFLLGLIVVLIMAPAWADDIQSNDMNTAGNVGGIRTYGLSGSLGDVDINDCLASTQLGIAIVFQRQGLVENPWCQASYLDAIGAHEAAAKVRCTTDTLQAIYPDSKECETAAMFRVERVDKFTDDNIDKDEEDEHEESLEPIYARLSDLETQRQSDADNARKAARRPIPQPQTIIHQQEFIDDDKRAKLAALRAEK